MTRMTRFSGSTLACPGRHIHAVHDRRLIQHHLCHGDDRGPSLDRAPDVPYLDDAFLDQFFPLARRAGPHQHNFIGFALFLDGAAGTDRTLATEDQNPFQVWVGQDRIRRT
jgi:hypothetical protein